MKNVVFANEPFNLQLNFANLYITNNIPNYSSDD